MENLRYRGRAGFTLIELLIVIAVIAALAAMIFPVTRIVNQNKIRSRARAELAQVQTAIENYKTALGHYPPDHPVTAAGQTDYSLSQLYYELSGIQPSSAAATFFGVSGIINRSRGSGDEGRPAKNFFSSTPLAPTQLADYSSATFIVSSMSFPQVTFAHTGNKPPFCYNSSNPAHNKNSYDLWIDVMVGNQTNRICNWSDRPLIGVTTYP